MVPVQIKMDYGTSFSHTLLFYRFSAFNVVQSAWNIYDIFKAKQKRIILLCVSPPPPAEEHDGLSITGSTFLI